MELNKKDLHCIARMLQGSFCKHEPFFCCSGYCQYSEECGESLRTTSKIHFDAVRQKLDSITGVWISHMESFKAPSQLPDSQ